MKKILFICIIVLFNTLLLSSEKLEKEKVYLQLKWLDQFQFAGYYMAKEKGFYKDNDLEVEFLKYNKNVNIVDTVLNKKATYGIGESELIVDKSNGKDIVLLSAIFQSTPLVLLAKKSSNINSVEDFKQKTMMLSPEQKKDLSIMAMMHKHKISMNDVTLKSYSLNLNDFIENKTDIITAYLSNEPFYLKQQNIKYNVFDPKDYGFDFYSDLLFTSDEEVKLHPSRVQRFTDASVKGWQYAFSHIQETVDVILSKYNSQNKSKEALIFEAKELKKLAYYKTTHFGHIDLNKIYRTYDIYNIIGFIDKKINFEKFVLDNYDHTNVELFTQEQKEYIKNKKYITMCADPSWMPFEKIENDKLIGMSAEYIKIMHSKIKIPFVLVPTKTWSESIEFAKQRKCDILSLVMSTPNRKKYMNFTTPHASIPLVIATRNDKVFISDISDVLDKKFTAVKGYAFTELLRVQYPTIKIIKVKNNGIGISKVKNKEVFGFIDTLPTVAYALQRDFSNEMKITGKINKTWELGFGVRNDDPILLEILEKASNSIEKIEKENIMAKWTKVKLENGFDYDMLWKLLVVILFISAYIFYRYTVNKKYNEKLNQKRKIIDKYVLISYTGIDGIITDVSQAFCDTTGYTKEELIGQTHAIFKHPDTDPEIFDIMWETISSGKEFKCEIKNLAKDGSAYWIDAVISPVFNKKGEVEGYTGIRYDITDKKKIQELSVTDQLTKLSNRLHLDKSFNREVKYTLRDAHPFCVVMLDIDFFKLVNDTYGHDIGDSVLKEISVILKSNVRDTDILGRWGGEEFMIIFHKTNLSQAIDLSQKICQNISNHNFDYVDNITCSFGVSEFKIEDTDKEVIKRADKALYEAKDSGRNCVKSQ